MRVTILSGLDARVGPVPTGERNVMTERMSAADLSLLMLEGRTTPMHMGSLSIFKPPPGGFDYEHLVELLDARLSLVPRYRQKVRAVPGRLANPLWIDDVNFDITFHVRRSALPKPGSEQQLRDFCARILSRPLDRARPLWEVYLIDGIADGRVAIVTKTHHAMVDGSSTIDIGQVILDVTPHPPAHTSDIWMPQAEPSSAGLIVGAFGEALRRPASVLDTRRLGRLDARSVLPRVLSAAGGVASIAVATMRPGPASPLSTTVGEQRRLALARTDLADYKSVRRARGGTVHDVVLATVTGALREWLIARGAKVGPSTTVRAMVPVSVHDRDELGAGNRVSGIVVELPVGEPNAMLRLAQITHRMDRHHPSGQSVGADALISLTGFAPATLHAMGARAVNEIRSRLYNLVVQNVPGPQLPLYAGGARMTEMFPIVPLTTGHALAIGLTSYDGQVCYGLNGDRDAMPDVDVLAVLIEESLSELLALSGQPPTARPALAAARNASSPRRGQ